MPYVRFAHRRRAALVLAAVAAFLVALIGSGVPGAAAFGRGPQPGPQAPNCGAAIAKSTGGYWTCTFADDFSGFGLDRTKWSVVRTADYGFHSSTECYVDSPSTVSVFGGYLNLTVRKQAAPFTCTDPYGNYTSQWTAGMVTTAGHFSQTYGRFAIRASFPASTIAGLQSALWMYSEATGAPTGEIDLAEEYSLYPDRAIPTLHYNFDPSTVDPTTGTNVWTNYYCMLDVGSFHEYVLEWTSSRLTISYDGQTCVDDHLLPSGTSPFDQPFYLLLTQGLGLGADAPTDATPAAATTQIDWVRAWK